MERFARKLTDTAAGLKRETPPDCPTRWSALTHGPRTTPQLLWFQRGFAPRTRAATLLQRQRNWRVARPCLSSTCVLSPFVVLPKPRDCNGPRRASQPSIGLGTFRSNHAVQKGGVSWMMTRVHDYAYLQRSANGDVQSPADVRDLAQLRHGAGAGRYLSAT